MKTTKFKGQSEEETGSAGKQPVSNKADGDDSQGRDLFTPFFIISALMAKKTHLIFHNLFMLTDLRLHLFRISVSLKVLSSSVVITSWLCG